MKKILLAVGFAVVIFEGLSAQATVLDYSRASNAAYFNYTRTGDVSVIVNIWGTIRHPGRYELTRGSNLGDAISLAGGPSDTGERPDEFDRIITVSLSRKGITGREVIFQSELSQIVESNMSLPALLDDDVLYINTVSTSKPNFRSVYLPAMNLVATGLLIILRIAEFYR
ncbi:MAG TPA: SLBB domain-containing protein [Rhodothermales bacterium]|nr:SLBB domain-containing protein [Rhodothermales bacterium]